MVVFGGLGIWRISDLGSHYKQLILFKIPINKLKGIL